MKDSFGEDKFADGRLQQRDGVDEVTIDLVFDIYILNIFICARDFIIAAPCVCYGFLLSQFQILITK